MTYAVLKSYAPCWKTATALATILMLSSACSTRSPRVQTRICTPTPALKMLTAAERQYLSPATNEALAIDACDWARACTDYSTKDERKGCPTGK